MPETNPIVEDVAAALRLAREARAGVDAIPSRYASGLMALAKDAYEKGDVAVHDRILDGLATLSRAIETKPWFRRLLEDPRLPAERQLALVLAVLDDPQHGIAVPREVRNFVGVVVKNRRAALLGRIIAAYRALDAERRGEEGAEVVSAVPLDDTQRAQLLAALNRAGHARVRLAERVDPAILGGLVVKIGSRLYDSSIRSRLQRLAHAMKGAT
ncbi:MAG: ATP synthase F1 subunit delta [Elioraea sp.]|nr:ATP synthase F1 subunit delta [Elioraea sp.]